MVRPFAGAVVARGSGEIFREGKDGAADGRRLDDLAAPRALERAGRCACGVVAARHAPIQRADHGTDDCAVSLGSSLLRGLATLASLGSATDLARNASQFSRCGRGRPRSHGLKADAFYFGATILRSSISA